MKQIIKLEKQEDHRTTTSKASPLMKSFTSDNDDFRFHHYFDFVGGTSTGG
jgi:patatin-like phospholipase/acyl hydrolase